MSFYLLRLLFLLVIYGISIDTFHHMIRGPSTIFHNINIWHSDGVKDTCAIVSQVMEPEVPDASSFQCLAEPQSDRIRRAGNVSPF